MSIPDANDVAAMFSLPALHSVIFECKMALTAKNKADSVKFTNSPICTVTFSYLDGSFAFPSLSLLAANAMAFASLGYFKDLLESDELAAPSKWVSVSIGDKQIGLDRLAQSYETLLQVPLPTVCMAKAKDKSGVWGLKAQLRLPHISLIISLLAGFHFLGEMMPEVRAIRMAPVSPAHESSGQLPALWHIEWALSTVSSEAAGNSILGMFIAILAMVGQGELEWVAVDRLNMSRSIPWWSQSAVLHDLHSQLSQMQFYLDDDSFKIGSIIHPRLFLNWPLSLWRGQPDGWVLSAQGETVMSLTARRPLGDMVPDLSELEWLDGLEIFNFAYIGHLPKLTAHAVSLSPPAKSNAFTMCLELADRLMREEMALAMGIRLRKRESTWHLDLVFPGAPSPLVDEAAMEWLAKATSVEPAQMVIERKVKLKPPTPQADRPWLVKLDGLQVSLIEKPLQVELLLHMIWPAMQNRQLTIEPTELPKDYHWVEIAAEKFAMGQPDLQKLLLFVLVL